MTKTSFAIKELPRGGYLITTSEGVIQIGVPPETIKDTMIMEEGVPQVFVLPTQLFHLAKGISLAEIEFPIYFNFFLKKQKTKIICLEERIPGLKVALSESLYGPTNIDLRNEFLNDEVLKTMPDLKQELDYFRRGLNLDMVIEFLPFKNNKVDIGDVQIIINPDKSFTIKDGTGQIAKINGDIKFHIKYDMGTLLDKQFDPPMMGMTCLGPSHGFDPTQNTSGFILWLNGSGIMIDPPVNSTEWLEKSNVNPKLIDSIILTHCHADHDAGTFQKILEELKVTVYTTETVMMSFLKKYSALTNLSIPKLQDAFYFSPVIVGKKHAIHGGIFSFFYTLHPIPTIGFKVSFKGKSMVYSSDHLNEPKLFDTLYQDGIFSEERKNSLLDFPWDSDIIYHEAGIPPIHTRIDYLNSLPQEIQEKVIVYHISEKDFPKNTKLRLAKFGIGDTVVLPVPRTKYDDAARILQIFDNLEHFRDLPLYKMREILSIVQEEVFKPGARIIKKDSFGNKFYIIIEGKVQIEGLQTTTAKTYGKYQTFGETSLLFNKPRAATIIASSEVIALTIEREAFLNLIEGTEVEDVLIKLAESRDSSSWELLSESYPFKNTTTYQKTSFESLIKLKLHKKGDVLIEQGKLITKIYLIKEGTVKILKDGKYVQSLIRGTFVGDVMKLRYEKPSTSACIAETDVELYEINRDDMIAYLDKNPNVYMALIYR